jgi:hypothetical protein
VLGIRGTSAEVARVTAILRTHAARVETYLRGAAPELAAGWTIGTTSVRAVEERDRGLSPHASNELVHVDAGAYGATHGARILRFFVNHNPLFDRVWSTRGTLAEVLERWGERAGIVPPLDLAAGPLDRLRSGAARLAGAVGLPFARALDSSPYDRVMRRIHDFMKDDPAFRAGRDGLRELRFPPGSAWMVMTDGVSHACTAGSHALVSTFLVPLANSGRPELTPHALLTRAGVGPRGGAVRPLQR